MINGPIAVLGANGFVGSHILRYLRANGCSVRAVVRRPPASDGNYRIADACDVYALREAFHDCEYVVHAALGDNYTITGSIAPVYAAAEAVAARRLIYISSGSVHGQSPRPGTDERSSLSIRHAFSYNNAKVRAERKLARLRARGTVETVILRPTIVFGPGSRWVFDFADSLQNGTASLVDGAHGICNSIYVDNLSFGVMLALTAPNVDGEAFLLADAETVRWRDLYRPIAEAFGVDFDTVPSVSPRPPQTTLRQRYLDPVLASELLETVKQIVPRDTREHVKRALRHAIRSARGFISAAPPPSGGVPDEIAELQRCQWRLPHDKAARMLGYAPPVSFAEGCRRSIAWLRERSRRMSLAS